jgi:hypothetical protein
VVTYIQPRLVLGRMIGSAALTPRRFTAAMPTPVVPTRRFHEAVVLDAIRFRSYASEELAQVPTMILLGLEAYSFFGVIRSGIGLTRRLGANCSPQSA